MKSENNVLLGGKIEDDLVKIYVFSMFFDIFWYTTNKQRENSEFPDGKCSSQDSSHRSQHAFVTETWENTPPAR